jgi:hypothetical protein
MKKTVIRICTLILALATSQTILHAQRPQFLEDNRIEGAWQVNVAVVDCQTGAPIRNVQSLQLFSRDHSFSETANTASRGSSIGTWLHNEHDRTYNTTFWFYRYNPDGTFKSMAEGLDVATVSSDGSTFTSTGTITDYDATGNVLSVGCVTHAATRLDGPGR